MPPPCGLHIAIHLEQPLYLSSYSCCLRDHPALQKVRSSLLSMKPPKASSSCMHIIHKKYSIRRIKRFNVIWPHFISLGYGFTNLLYLFIYMYVHLVLSAYFVICNVHNNYFLSGMNIMYFTSTGQKGSK